MMRTPSTGRLRAMLLILLGSLVGSAAWAASAQEGLFVSQIAIDPRNPKNLYVLTTYSIGFMKSNDGGGRWTQSNQGIRSYSLYQLTVHPTNPDILYLGAGGAGLYKSTDAGATWVEMNNGLQNTDIGQLALHPEDPETVYVVTSRGLFKSPDGGGHWIPLNQGDDFTSSQQFQSLVILPTSPPTFYLASNKGLYTRREGDAGWVLVNEFFRGKRISAVAYDNRTQRLYAAVLRRGRTAATLGEGGLFASDDAGRHWARLDRDLGQVWIQSLVFDPARPDVIYLATTGRGVMKSEDRGKSWQECNAGLTDPDGDIRSLVLDPLHPGVMYAGTHGEWVFRSADACATWNRLPIGPHQTAPAIRTSLVREDETVQAEQLNPAPALFNRCNRCHGWTDPRINRSTGTWRVTANRRDWSITVKRMSKGAGLGPEEAREITAFLTKYTADKSAAKRKAHAPREHPIPISAIRGVEEEDPVAVRDGKGYTVFWQSNRNGVNNYDIYSARMDPGGLLRQDGQRPVSTAASNQIFPDAAWGKGQYLVVWQDLRSGQRWDIFAARVQQDGTVLDPQGIAVATGGGNAQYPRVAWDGEHFLVVWMEEQRGSGWDVAGVRISPGGAVLDTPPIPIARAPGNQEHPALAWGNGAYLVAWTDHQSGSRPRIRAARITPAGKVQDPTGLVLSSAAASTPRFPAVTWAQDRFVTVWSETRQSPTKQRSADILMSGVRADGRQAPPPFPITRDTDFKTFPAVSCKASTCLAVWEQEHASPRPMRGITDLNRDVRGAWIDIAQGPPTVTDVMIAPGATGNHFPRVILEGSRSLVVWKDYGTGVAAALGRILHAGDHGRP